ncbi:EAL domain-containing protein [Photobacterium damselae]|uniref:EAL domain-containing protein n=1 Tax=Photobacterium damselae TaxID=38293 RepID=UPI00406984F9
MIKYFLSVRQETNLQKLGYVVLSFILILGSFEVSSFSYSNVTSIQQFSLPSGVMVALVYLLGSSAIMGTFASLLCYYTFFKYIDSGAAYVYTLILTITLIVSLSFIKWVRYHNHSTKLIFGFFVFLFPALSSLTLVIFAPDSFRFDFTLNLFLADSISILLLSPLLGMFFLLIYNNKNIKEYLKDDLLEIKKNLLIKIILIGFIIIVMLFGVLQPLSYMAYILLMPLLIVAVVVIPIVCQIILINISYLILLSSSYTNSNDIHFINTKLTIFYMMAIIVFIILDFKVSLKKEIKDHKKHVFVDNCSNLGTYQKLESDSKKKLDFIIAAIDLHSLFKFPIKKRETLLSMIATLLKDQTSLYNSSYILYDVSSLVIILEDNKRSISKLRSFIDIVNNELDLRGINYELGKSFYMYCEHFSRLKTVINHLHINAKLADPLSEHKMINCDSNEINDYISFLSYIDEQQINIAYQNYYSVQGGAPCFEVLSRFNFNQNFLNPERVFTFAKRLNRTEELEQKVSRKALCLIKELTEESYQYASINFSPDFLCSTACVNFFIKQLLLQEISPNKICIELVETGEIEDTTTLINNLNKLKALGIKIALDDFGKGHATYEKLFNLPIDIVKVDGSLVRFCDQDLMKQLIIENVCKISSMSNIKVVAECVETPEEREILEQLNIDYLQGYLIHKPALF